MKSKDFNDAFRRALRREEPPTDETPPPAKPTVPASIDGGAGTGGRRTDTSRPSMNDFIRRSARDRERD